MTEATQRPEGHITILFTDMENSSSISRSVGADVYRTQLREPHNRIIRHAIEEATGFEIGTPAGDSFMAVFHQADQAVRCALLIQRGFQEAPIAAMGPDGREYHVRVRVGVHTAEEPLRLSEEGEYVGADVALAKRVESLGVGEQVIVSSSAYRSCAENRQFHWQRWPNRRLKGFDRLETVWELLWDGQSRGEPGAASKDLHEQARKLEEQKRWAEAEQLYLQSLEVMRSYGDRSGECRTLNNLGSVRLRQGLWPEGEEALRASLDLARQLGDRSTETRVLMNLGICLHRRRRFLEAERYYRRSIRLREELGDRAGLSRCLRYLGLQLQEAGQLEEAREVLEEALEVAREQDDRAGQAGAHRALGLLGQLQGRDAPAEEHYKAALELVVGMGDRHQEAQVLSNMAVLNQQFMRNSRAERFHRSSLNIFRELGDDAQALKARLNYGTFMLSLGQTSAARRELEKVFDEARNGGDDETLGASMGNLALLFDANGDWAGALNIARKASQILERSGNGWLHERVEGWVKEWSGAE